MFGHHPSSIQFDVVSAGKYGKYIAIDGDAREYFLQPGQRWIPHALPDRHHPAKIGQIITVVDSMIPFVGAPVVMVSGVRTFKNNKRDPGVRQVEILGLPWKWWSIGHFEEFRGSQHYFRG